MKNKRVFYLCLTLVLFFVELFIALYIRDSFVRPFLGDVLVVIFIYTFIRIFLPDRFPLLPLFIFVFAAGVEVLQLFQIVDLLGLGGISFFRILIGSVFDIKDIVCYAVGCIVLGIYEYAIDKNKT